MPAHHPNTLWLFLQSLLLLFFLLLSFFPLTPIATTATLAQTQNQPPASLASHKPLIMLSTMDGTVTAFDAQTGAVLFTHHDPHPAVDSWAAPGLPEYVPSLDGLLYRIDPGSDEAHIIDAKFINQRQSTPKSPLDPPSADALILTKEDSSVLYIDLRTGRLLRQLSFSHTPPSDPVLPHLSDHVLVISRTSVHVRVLDADSNQELANATLVHTAPTFLDRGDNRCQHSDTAYLAYVTPSREKLTVFNAATGAAVWSKNLPTPVVEAHGMAGVRMASSRREVDAIGRSPDSNPTALQALDAPHPDNQPSAPNDVLVNKHGKYVYATLAAPGADPEEDRDGRKKTRSNRGRNRFRKGLQRYRIYNAVDPRSLPAADRLLGRGKLPTRGQRAPGPSDNTFVVTSRDVGLAFLAMIVVGYVGYMVGRRPRERSERARRKKRVLKKRPRVQGDAEVEAEGTGTSAKDEEEEEREPLVYKHGPGREVWSDREGNPLAFGEMQMESSSGSTGSAAGFVSNRTQSGWMTVGCLHVSAKVLGVGSHGTVVYEGKMMPGERKVAVKRLLRQFFESARKEISLLVELDEASPHVVRYFAMEEDSEFIYLALELCAASLAERVAEKQCPVPPATYRGGPPPVYTSRALRQLLQGLADLHRVGVVHRDVKPQNVLITRSTGGNGDVKLADVGLALRLAANRSSYTAITNAGGGVGTTGWRAPEVLRGGRQTKAVDIFAAGCVVCFVLTGGKHPFGNAIFGRDGNIVAGNPSLEDLESLELPEATDIVKKMIDPVATQRPSADEALRHPFFWTDAAKLSFLVDISDRLYDTRHDPARYTENLDRYYLASQHCSDWLVRMDMELLMGLGRGYDNTASGVLRVIRNKRNHYSELSPSLQKLLGPLPEDKHRSHTVTGRSDKSTDSEDMTTGNNFLTYFTSRVPHLLMCVYHYAIENPVLIDQPHFSRYGLKATNQRSQVPLHPLVRKARATRIEGPTASRIAVVDEQRDGIVGENDFKVSEGVVEAGDNIDMAVSDSWLDEMEVVVATKSDRRAYHRHELVALQAMCPTMQDDVMKRVMSLELYQATAYARYRKRLATNQFEDSDFETVADRDVSTTNTEVPPAFQRMPKRPNQQGPPGFAPRTSHYMSSSPSSRPPGFGGPSGTPGNNIGNNTYPRRNPAPGITPTVSQFSGEERVVDFGALRRRR